MSAPLHDFLLARIAEDEAVARAVVGRGVHDDRPVVKEWIGLANPNRMLVWSNVRRNLIGLHATKGHPDGARTNGTEPMCAGCAHPVPCPTLRVLATLYADHPDFEERWRPQRVSG